MPTLPLPRHRKIRNRTKQRCWDAVTAYIGQPTVSHPDLRIMELTRIIKDQMTEELGLPW